jgi:hypothetical protein
MRLRKDMKQRSKLRDSQRGDKAFSSNAFLDDEDSSPETDTEAESFVDIYSDSGYDDFDDYDWLADNNTESYDDADLDDPEDKSYKMLTIPAIVGLLPPGRHIILTVRRS